jgi:hypothetical protein
MCRALLAFASDSASKGTRARAARRRGHASKSSASLRAREQEQRVADSSSQPPASRRSIRAWWPDEGSALEMAYSSVDHRILWQRTNMRLSRGKPAAACGTRASRMHGVRNAQLAVSPAVANRPAEAALCLESRASTMAHVYHPNMDFAKTFTACAYQYATNASLRLDGRDLRHAPRSHHIAGVLEVECEG